MTLFRISGPEVEPVTLVEAKAELRIDHAGEDDLIAALIRAAREEVEQATGMALIDQTWRLAADHVPASGLLRLRRGPVKEILSVTTHGSEGEAALIDPADYQLDLMSDPVRLLFSKRPGKLRAMNGIEVDFVAGFGEAGPDVPDLLKRAMLMLVTHWFEFRASLGAGSRPVSYPDGYRRLLWAYLPRRLA